MNLRPLHTLPALALLATLAACELTSGESGTLLFDDETTGATGLDRPMATGSTLIVEATCSGCTDPVVTNATSLDPDLLEVVATQNGEVTVRGLADGTARLEVTVDEVGTDVLPIEIAPATQSTMRLEPWGDAAPLPPALWSDTGFAMLAGSETQARAFPRDAQGERLTGFGAITWAIDGGAVTEVADRRDDRVEIIAPDEPASLTLTLSTGETQPIEVVTESEIATLELAIIDADAPTIVADGAAWQVARDASVIVHLVARTADGAYISGPGSELATLTVGEELDGAVRDLAVDAIGGLGDAEGDATALRTFYERAFLLEIDADAGTGELVFAWLGRELTVTLE